MQIITQLLQRIEPRAADFEVTKRLPSSRGRQQREVLFALRVPCGVTHHFPAKDGSMAGSTIDFMIISVWKGKLPPTTSIITFPAACASDHFPISVIITIWRKMSDRAKKLFLPTQHRINSEAVQEAALQYRAQLQRLAAKMRLSDQS